MKDDQRGPIARRRPRRASVRSAGAQTITPQPRVSLDRALALPLIDRVLSRLLGHPRALQGAGILVGVVMVVLALRPLIWPADLVRAPTSIPAMQRLPALALPAPTAPPEGTSEQEVLSVVAAYNQASITAAVLGRVDMMAPYLAPDSKPWTAAQAEYRRRATRGETHDPALTRWGVLRIAAGGDTATVETQEQWDDVMSVGGQVITSKRGILTRNTYVLRRSPSLNRWLITDVATTTLIN